MKKLLRLLSKLLRKPKSKLFLYYNELTGIPEMKKETKK